MGIFRLLYDLNHCYDKLPYLFSKKNTMSKLQNGCSFYILNKKAKPTFFEFHLVQCFFFIPKRASFLYRGTTAVPEFS